MSRWLAALEPVRRRPRLRGRFAYPDGGTQRITLIGLTREAYEEHLSDRPDSRLRTDTPFDVRHRAMLAACVRGADRFEITERLLDLLGSLPPRAATSDEGRPATRKDTGGWWTPCSTRCPPAT